VALDGDCRLLALGQSRLKDLLAYIAGQSAVVLAVNAPAPGQAGAAGQESLFPLNELPCGSGGELEATVRAAQVAGDGVKVSPRLRNAAVLYGYVKELGFRFYPAEEELRQVLATDSETAYRTWVGKRLYEARSLEGRMQRQMILSQQRLPINNPMDFLEEVTPRKLVQGSLPLEKIAPAGELQAWMAANVAWLAGVHEERVGCEDGVYLPVNP
jgi:hypothetical protein